MNFNEDEKDDRVEKLINSLIGKAKKIGIVFAGLLFIYIFVSMFWFETEAGYSYFYQNTLFSTEDAFFDVGVHFKIPGFSYIESYKQVCTIDFEKSILDKAGEIIISKKSTSTALPIGVIFADTYTALLPASFRFELPKEKKAFITMHKTFRSFDNLVNSLLIKTARDVMVNTATQYTGEEFFLGAINQFKYSVKDQLLNGLYKTERKRVEITEASLAPIGVDQENSEKIEQTKQLVWKTIPMSDKDGKLIRQDNPLTKYSVLATQFTMDKPEPEGQLEKLLVDKKNLVAERIKTVQAQETAKERIKTEQLQGDIDRTKAKQKALKEKELAIIKKQREVEEAQKQAEKELIEEKKLKDLAVIQKQKELEISQANKGIQKANYESAQYEAKAIKEKGIAEAAVTKAKYDAIDTNLYTMEMKRDIALALYNNLRNFEVKMPNNMISSGGSDGSPQTNLDILTSLATIDFMEGKGKTVKNYYNNKQ